MCPVSVMVIHLVVVPMVTKDIAHIPVTMDHGVEEIDVLLLHHVQLIAIAIQADIAVSVLA